MKIKNLSNNKLWTRDFSIITIGSIISMLGNAVSGFAIGLVVLDYTNSTFLYALFMVVYNLPKIVVPLFAGPYLDRFSRKKVIYTLDFLSAFIYLWIFLFINSGNFSYSILITVCLFIGLIDSIYIVAYDSFYPNLITEGNFSKAYSIASMIYPLSAFMVPVASLIYNRKGTAAYLFLFNAISFFIAACFELSIKFKETHMKKEYNKNFDFAGYKSDFKEGLTYIKQERGLLDITLYFCLTMFAGSAIQTVILPFFKNNPNLFSNINIDVVTLFTFVTGFGVIGRLIGGVIHYKFKYPVNKKFIIAITVYLAISIIEGIQLFLPVNLMMLCFFITGIMGVTSYNIRISATQSYVPDEKRGRFNGIFNMICAAGGILGQLLGGGMAEFISERSVTIVFALFNVFAVIFVMYRGRNNVKKIYNREV